MKKKTVALLLALVLVLGVAAGGTLAWLTANTQSVTNTFTTSDIAIKLEETKKDFQMVPGYTIDKDPKVTVETGSEYCWLFVKIDESTTLDTYITYSVDSKWTQGKGTTGEDADGIPTDVWYMEIDTAEEINVAHSVLTNDKVTVNSTVTKTQMEALEAENATQPTLTFTAYASQLYKNNSEKFSAAEAWANVSNPAGTTGN